MEVDEEEDQKGYDPSKPIENQHISINKMKNDNADEDDEDDDTVINDMITNKTNKTNETNKTKISHKNNNKHQQQLIRFINIRKNKIFEEHKANGYGNKPDLN